MNNLIYQYDDFEDEYEDEGMAYRRRARIANLTQTREVDFITLKGEAEFFILIIVGRRLPKS